MGKPSGDEQRRSPQHPQVQQEQAPHIGEVVLPTLGPTQHAGGELLRPQAVVQHLVIGGADFLLGQPGLLREVEGADVSVVEGPAQDGQGDGPGQQNQGGGDGEQAGYEFSHS